MEQGLLFGLSISLLVVSAVSAAVQPLRLTQDGRPGATIVLPEHPNEQESLAAKELQDYVRRISGAELAIVSEPQAVNPPCVFIGRTAAAARLGGVVKHHEGFRLAHVGEDLFIVGGGPFGTLYGAYELLEKLGVRWYIPDPNGLGEYVPAIQTIQIGDLDETQEPDFEMRWVGNEEWWWRNKGNRLAGFDMIGGTFHSMQMILPQSKFYDEHPEYYAANAAGERRLRKDWTFKLCHSNPEVPLAVAREMGRLLDENPHTNIINLSPTDGRGYCQCANCAAIKEKDVPIEQSMSRILLLFYNRVAEELEKTHPEARIVVGAYQDYRLPPKDRTIRGHRNLALILCRGFCGSHAVNDPQCPSVRQYNQSIADWQRIIPDVYFYEYYNKLAWRGMPLPIVHAIAAEIPYFKEIGCKGLFTQYSRETTWTLGLNYYVAAKLLWNARTDVSAILEEYYQNMFEDAAPAVKRYYTAMEEAASGHDIHLPGDFLDAGPRFFNEAFCAELGGYLEEARAATRNEKVLARLEKLSLSLAHTVRMMEYARLYNSAEEAPTKQEKLARLETAAAHMEAIIDDIRTRKDAYWGVVSQSMVATGGERAGGYIIRILQSNRREIEALRAKVAKDLVAPGD